MSKKIVALLGAGGKMGCRIVDNLKNHPDYDLLPIEPSEAGAGRLAERGLTPVPAAEAVPKADYVILALPDTILGRVSHDTAPLMKPGAMMLTLDPAAAHAGVLADRPDISRFVTHPCHPPLFGDETDPEARRDFFGGVKAKQAIVCALMSGPDEAYGGGEALATAMYAPVTRSHRITVEQMAILEPAMAETVTACCCTIIREAMDLAIAKGVPPEAAKDFMMGHVNIPLAIVFGEVGSPFSDGAKLIIEHGRKMLFKEDWQRVFEPESVREQVEAIVQGKPAG
ncbi:MAG: semialdehyde dehydrogenase [Fimbriimonadaceae bacterium]|nr:semialdehyde dehydrogenase [Fimbriimonadaceae bacterium]